MRLGVMLSEEVTPEVALRVAPDGADMAGVAKHDARIWSVDGINRKALVVGRPPRLPAAALRPGRAYRNRNTLLRRAAWRKLS
jgi:hypothetical protein